MNTINTGCLSFVGNEHFTNSIPSKSNAQPTSYARTQKRKISLYRNASPGIVWKQYKKNQSPCDSPDKKPNFVQKILLGKSEIKNIDRTINENDRSRSRFQKKTEHFNKDLEIKVRISNVKRAVSQKITRKTCEAPKKRNLRHFNLNQSSGAKENRRIVSRSPIKKETKIGDFTSISPKVKRRFGSVTVGRVVRKREISRSIRKSSNLTEVYTNDFKMPLKK
jgi:hypothetical protein